MDATRARRAWVLAVVLTCGCTWDYQTPTARREIQPPPEPQEPPQVVDTPTTSEAKTADDEGEVQMTVLGWVERIEHVDRQPPTRGHASDSVRYALDMKPPTPFRTPTPVEETEQIPVEVESPEHPTSQPGEPDEPVVAAPAPPTLPEPPRLAAVAVRAAPTEPATSPPPAAGTFTPHVNVPARATDAPPSLRDLIERLPPAPEGSFRSQLDRRMLWVVAGDYEQARAPLELVTAEQQELAARFIEAWIAIRNWHLGDQATAAAAAARELEALQTALRRLKDLSIPVVRICRSVRGFGQYDAIEPPRFLAGVVNEFVLYCELRDFVSERGDDGLYTTKFDLTTTILDRSGQTVLEIKDTDIVDRCATRRHDCFIPRLVRLPASLSAGNYVVKTTVVDKLGQKVAENRAAFELAAAP